MLMSVKRWLVTKVRGTNEFMKFALLFPGYLNFLINFLESLKFAHTSVTIIYDFGAKREVGYSAFNAQ